MKQTALVTGGTSGIGRATVLALAEAGYEVVATGLVEGEIDSCRHDAAFTDVQVVLLDVADSAAVARLMFAQKKLDVLVNAAGISRVTDEFTEEGFHRTLDVNLAGTMRCCYAAKPLLAINGGAIINIASTMSIFGSATAPAYAASKGAIVQFTKSLAMAWAPLGIRCNSVAPGWIDTPMTRSLQSKANEARYGAVLARTPLGRLGKPEEIAQAVVFLASPKSSFITGAQIPVDGGYLAHGL